MRRRQFVVVAASLAFMFPQGAFASGPGHVEKVLHEETAQTPNGTYKVTYIFKMDYNSSQSKHHFRFYCSWNYNNVSLTRDIVRQEPDGKSTTIDHALWTRGGQSQNNQKNCGRAMDENINPAISHFSDLHNWNEVEGDLALVQQTTGRNFDPYR